MSRNIFTSALIAAILVILVAGNIQAQTQQANADVGASASVLTALTITKNLDVVFGNLSATTLGLVYLSPKGFANSNYVGPNAAAGKVTIAAGISKSINITWPTSITLTDGNIPDDITYNLEVNGNTANVQGTSTLTTSGAGVTTSGTGGFYLWVGGSLVGLTHAVGDYTGTANFKVEYN